MKPVLLYCFLGLAWFLVIPDHAIAQCAGPNKTICKKQDVVIGPDSPNDAYCYKWRVLGEGSAIGEGVTSAQITVSPEETTTFELTIVGPNFEWKRVCDVTVFVEEVRFISVKTSRCCWAVGESFSADQFDIITDPPNYVGEIVFDPPEAQLISLMAPYGQETVNVQIECEEEVISMPVMVEVVREEEVIDRTLAKTDGKQVPLEFIGKIVTKFQDFLNRTKVIQKLGGITCDSVTVDFGQFEVKGLLKHECCKEGKTSKCGYNQTKVLEMSGGIGVNLGCEVQLPIAARQIAGGGIIAGMVSADGKLAKNSCKENNCILISPGALSGTIQLKTSNITSAIIEGNVSLRLEGILPEYEYCSNTERLEKKSDFCVSAVVSGKLDWASGVELVLGDLDDGERATFFETHKCF